MIGADSSRAITLGPPKITLRLSPTVTSPTTTNHVSLPPSVKHIHPHNHHTQGSPTGKARPFSPPLRFVSLTAWSVGLELYGMGFRLEIDPEPPITCKWGVVSNGGCLLPEVLLIY